MKRQNKFFVWIAAVSLLLLGYAGFDAQLSYAQDATTDAVTTDTSSSSLDNTSASQDSGVNFDAVVTQGEAQISSDPSNTADQEAVLTDETTAVAETDGNLPPVEVTASDEFDMPAESQPEDTLESIDQQNTDSSDADPSATDQSQMDKSGQDQTSTDTSTTIQDSSSSSASAAGH